MSRQRIVLTSITILLASGIVLATLYTAGLVLKDPLPLPKAGVEAAVVGSTWGNRLERVATADILIGGVVALAIATWRGVAAEQQARAARQQVDTALRQTETGQQQVETALRQTETAHQGLLFERYQKGAEMLGSDILAVRLAGIYALERLAQEQPDQYHVDIMQLLCAIVRPLRSVSLAENAASDELSAESVSSRPGYDTQAVVWAVGRRTQEQVRQEIEAEGLSTIDLSGIVFPGGHAEQANLTGAILEAAMMSRAQCHDIDLSGALLERADLSNADLSGANLFGSRLWFADLDDGILRGAILWSAEMLGARMQAADLSGADLWEADCTGAVLRGANFSGADLANTDLTAADISGARFSIEGRNPALGLTQEQLDAAYAQEGDSPILEGVVDSETGSPLEWRD